MNGHGTVAPSALDDVTRSYRAARLADRHGWPRLVCDAYCEHLKAITAALVAGHTGAEINAARRIA